MAMDLDLLPVEADEGRWGFSHTVLRCDNGRGLKYLIDSMKPLMNDVPDDFTTYRSHTEDGQTVYGNTQVDSRGDQVRCLRVSQLLELEHTESVQISERNRAVWAYLKQLNPRIKVALYWH
jgi:hypothetical protein